MGTAQRFIIISNKDINAPEEQLVDSNCACSDAINILERVVPTGTVPNKLIKANVHTESLINDMIVVFNPLGQAGPVVLNHKASQLLNRFEQPQAANSESESVQSAMHRLAELELLEPFGSQRRLQRADTQTLVAWLHTTNACNLRCTYCYIEKNEETMPNETGLAAVNAIFRAAQQHRFKQVKLKYAGGESTLNFRLIEQLHNHALELAKNTGIKLNEVILSNGIALTTPMLDFIREQQIRLTISLDGIGEGHDAQRVFVNGKGSSQHVVRAIKRAVKQGVQPHLSITVSGRNGDDVVEAVKLALEHDLLFNLNFYRENDRSATHADLLAEDEQMIATVKRCFAAIEANPPKHSLLASLVDRSNFAAAHEHACGAGHNYMVIDQHGKVSRCQMEIERSVTDVFASDPLTEIRLYDQGFQNSSVEEKSGCRDCQWRYWCAGGCPSLTYRVTGRNDVKSPYCNVYKAIYPELLKVEGIRLLQQYS